MSTNGRKLISRMGWRPRRQQRVAFVFSGGGPLAAVQVGQLGALFTMGITPDMAVGTSAGALNAIYIASNPSVEGASALRELWIRMKKEDLFPRGRLMSAIQVLRRGSHVYSSEGLRRLVANEFPDLNFEDLAIPAHVVATHLDTGEETWFSTGPILEPLLASSAMPGVFPPVLIDGGRYIDGGVANNIPFSRAVELGATRIYVLNVHSSFQQRPLNRPHDFVMHGYLLARAQRYRHDLEECRRVADVIEFPAIDVGYVPFTNLTNTERLIDAGFEEAMKFLKEGADVRPLIPEPNVS